MPNPVMTTRRLDKGDPSHKNPQPAVAARKEKAATTCVVAAFNTGPK
jgi:hypothetical protein